jgi:hypothetical protein
LFYSGAVVIQGAKCSKFTEFFSIYWTINATF